MPLSCWSHPSLMRVGKSARDAPRLVHGWSRVSPRRTAIAAIQTVVVAVLWAVARPVLGLFGEVYAGHAVLMLRVLLISALPVALNTWGIVVLRILGATRTAWRACSSSPAARSSPPAGSTPATAV